MKIWIACLAVLLMVWQPATADEGMWLMNKLGDIYPRMQARGLKIKDKEIYNEASASLTDAVVAVDGGMGSGSMISDQGLMITNHHVAYSDICDLSTPEKNILETGFWARTRGEEIPVQGKTVWFLRKVVDVTAEAHALKEQMIAQGKWGVMGLRRLYGELEGRYNRLTECEVSCSSMWGGKMFLMFYYDIYKDVRLVGTPPVTIGAFGGDHDNWSWPQHKGDFALYRVYADQDGRPVEYAEGNVPLKPRRVLRIATAGVHDGDFAMVIGFPGRTNRYSSSFAVAEKEHIKNPIVVENRQARMGIIKRHMERDSLVRMKYSDAYFGLSNYADYAKWETKCLRRFGVVSIREQEEERLQQWIESDPVRQVEAGALLSDLGRGYDARREAEHNLNYFREAWFGVSEALLVANRLSSYLGKLDRLGRDSLDITTADAQSIVAGSGRLRRNYDAATDRDLLARMMTNFMQNIPRTEWGGCLPSLYDAAEGDIEWLARKSFDDSFCSDPERYDAYFSVNRSVAEIRRDPLVVLAESVRAQRFMGAVNEAEKNAGVDVGESEAHYMGLLYDFRSSEGVTQYPNANSTMRLTYGNVEPLSPSDGVHCDARSTIAGYLEKYNPGDYEFRVDERMRRLIAAKDWGRWGENGTLYVNFLTNNDITGGNSGSPVLDGRGRLVGLAFDGNRESMAGDIWFHPELARTVSVDIRYVMWVIEKYAGAGWLLDEMRFEK
ncbi:S46 family peptidase [uncultured Alistipes sp.]|uniref:S46 family peptidase n=1 Tax=uncultured Alistipes sp. TaxID=538949 RepID=UPI0025F35644|nr:S46 family peptidase [uncultured Alistipes sp.]